MNVLYGLSYPHFFKTSTPILSMEKRMTFFSRPPILWACSHLGEGFLTDTFDLVSPQINEYCIRHSTVPSEDCENIRHYTEANVPMSIMVTGALESSFLGFLMGLVGAERVLEIGCYTGYSSLAMAERLPPKGELITLDINPETAKIAQSFWNKSPHGKKIKLRLGDALISMEQLSAPFDLVFIDADKPRYGQYLEKALPLLSPGGVIVCDNTLYSQEVLQPKSENARALAAFNAAVHGRSDLECTLLPVRDGLLLVRKKV